MRYTVMDGDSIWVPNYRHAKSLSLAVENTSQTLDLDITGKGPKWNSGLQAPMRTKHYHHEACIPTLHSVFVPRLEILEAGLSTQSTIQIYSPGNAALSANRNFLACIRVSQLPKCYCTRESSMSSPGRSDAQDTGIRVKGTQGFRNMQIAVQYIHSVRTRTFITAAVPDSRVVYMASNSMSSTVPPVPTNKSAKSKKAKNDRKRHNGLESSPLMVLDRPADIAAAISEDRISIEDMTYIGSYSWVDSTEPTIVVPGTSYTFRSGQGSEHSHTLLLGSPAVWHDRRTPYTVPPDRVTFMYEDAYRMPQYPNLARMRAIDIMTAEKGIQVDWPSVDFITDRNALRKLLKWAGDTSGKDFRIDLELAGERTVFLNRWEAKTRNRLGPQEQSYGFAFEKASTHPAPDCQGTTGHHRISSYVRVSSSSSMSLIDPMSMTIRLPGLWRVAHDCVIRSRCLHRSRDYEHRTTCERWKRETPCP